MQDRVRTARPRPWKRAVALATAASVLLATAGCSFLVSSQQRITVTSDPPGARVIINGNVAGVTPLQTSIARREEALIMVSKPGYQTVTRTTTKSLSATGVVDIIGGVFLLVPFLGLLAPGAYEQEPVNIGVTLPEAE